MRGKPEVPNPYVLGGCVYYSQNREDLVLQSFFNDVKEGFYVDVGAFDPDLDSVTKLFYLQGWRGINIEPQAERYQKFNALRPRDINVQSGVSTAKGTLTLRTYKSEGLSTFSDEVKRQYEQQPDTDTETYSETSIPVCPLEEILAAHNITHIHFLKVDVEGFEYEVLASNDWKRFRPEVLCIEANHIQRDWHKILRDAQYGLVFDDGLNEYFVDLKTDRAKKFDYVQDVITKRGGGLRADHYEVMLQLRKLFDEKDAHVKELAKENKLLLDTLEDYRRRLDGWDSVMRTCRHLVGLIYRSMVGKG